MGIEAKEITVLMGILEKMRGYKDTDSDFSFSYKNGDEIIKVSNVSSSLVRLEFKGFSEISCDKIAMVADTEASDIERVKEGIESVDGKYDAGDIKELAEEVRCGSKLIDDLYFRKLKDEVNKEIIFSARDNDLNIIGKEFGEGFKNAYLSLLRCTEDHTVKTEFEKDKLQFEGKPSSDSEFAGKSYGSEEENAEVSSQNDEKTTDGNASDQSGDNGSSKKVKTTGEIIDEEAKKVISEKSEELYAIFNYMRDEGRIRIRSGKNNKILAGFNDVFKELLDAYLEKYIKGIIKAKELGIVDDRKKLEHKIRAEFRKAVENADGQIFGHDIKMSETEEKREKIRGDLDKFGIDKELKGIIANSYLEDESIGFYDEDGNIKDIEDIKEILRERVQIDLKSEDGLGEKYMQEIKKVRSDKGAYSRIEKVFNLIGLDMPE